MPRDTQYLKVSQVANRFNVSKQTVHNLRKSGTLESIRFGSVWLIPEDSLQKYVSRNSSSSDSERVSEGVGG